jgi:CDP-diglyceride synthetase
VNALLVFVPALGALFAQAPVMKLDAFSRLRRPIDGGRTLRGRRIFGDNKTWRGAIVMWTGTFLATLALSAWDPYSDALPDGVRSAGPLLVGALTGTGLVLAELPNSFLKRQLGIGPGARRRSPGGMALAILDQGDFTIGIAVALLPVWRIPVEMLALGFVVVSCVHLAISWVGLRIGVRRTAW